MVFLSSLPQPKHEGSCIAGVEYVHITIICNMDSSAKQFTVTSPIPLLEPPCSTSDQNNTSATHGAGTWEPEVNTRFTNIVV